MTKIGRNDPCWCGSGKKYKQCHLQSDDAAASEHRRLKQVGDALLPRIIEQAQQHMEAIPEAFARYWNNAYTTDQLAELDELEGRGAERFLTWFAFDYPLDDNRTLVARLAAGEELTWSEEETAVLHEWQHVRLQPFQVTQVVKGKELIVQSLLDSQAYTVDDQVASRLVERGEVLIVHLLPIKNRYFIGGAAAHLTADTAETLQAFAALHLEAMSREQPNTTYADLLRDRSHVLNHFVMALPVEEPDPSVFERILTQTRAALAPA